MTTHILVVDDETHARAKTIRFIRRHQPDAAISEAADGAAAVTTVMTLQPDLLFLDIQMPGMDGFEVLRQIPKENMPALVFVTAYDEYAVQAFEVHAVDYLLKPFDFDRFKTAFDRAVQTCSPGPDGNPDLKSDRATDLKMNRKIDRILDQMNRQSAWLRKITVKEGERIFFVPVSDIRYIEAQGKYIEIHTREANHLVRKSMQEMLDQLDPGRFFRIHRSHIVHIDHIRELQTWFHGDYQVILTDGTRLRLSRRYSRHLLAAMG